MTFRVPDFQLLGLLMLMGLGALGLKLFRAGAGGAWCGMDFPAPRQLSGDGAYPLVRGEIRSERTNSRPKPGQL